MKNFLYNIFGRHFVCMLHVCTKLVILITKHRN